MWRIYYLSILILSMCTCYASDLSACGKDLFSETFVQTNLYWIEVSGYRVSFLLPSDFLEHKSRFINSNTYQSDMYIDASNIFRKKDDESYFAVSLFDYGKSCNMDSLMNETISNLMPLFGDKCQSFWYNCGYLNGDPYVMVSDVASASYTEGNNMIKTSCSFKIFLKQGVCFLFLYDSICSRYNFQYEKILDIFKSIKIEKVKQ